MYQINTKDLRKIYDVEIDGHHYKVRKLGAGEQLTVSQAYRRLDKLSKMKEMSDAQEAEAMQLSQTIFQTMSGVFDDQKGGKVRDRFFNEADDFVVGEVLRRVFELQTENAEAKS